MKPATLSPGSLREEYAAGDLDPVAVVDDVYARIANRGDDGVWIALVPHEEARAAAARLDPADLDRLPLFGVPWAVKDNIDVVGMPTTAGCPGFAYVPAASAVLVDRLTAAGAILVGKTNLDQFATGLSGTRSPYGVPGSVADPLLISGGSSSGSAVAVASGLVSFSIGTDTAGSGRVPAALNGVVGLKPSVGLVSGAGLVPACRSLDCASVFATDVASAAVVLSVVAGFDDDHAWSRPLPVPPATPSPAVVAGLRIGVPAEPLEWGGRGEERAWSTLLDSLTSAGAVLVPVPMGPFWEAGDQLYQGVWLAERLEGLEEFVRDRPDAVLPVIREVLAGGVGIRGVETFAGLSLMQELRQVTRRLLAEVDALLTPTVTATYTIEEMVSDPVALNVELGRFTTFTNLLDLCAVAIPAGCGPAGEPFGVTLHAVAGRDAEVAAASLAMEGLLAGRPPRPARTDPLPAGFELAVVGAHLEGMPLHDALLERGAELVERTATESAYRLFALDGIVPPRPGLCRVDRAGAAIEVEVYRMPEAEVGAFLATVTAPLAIGQVVLADGRVVHGFVCEPAALQGALDITDFGGWRAYIDQC